MRQHDATLQRILAAKLVPAVRTRTAECALRALEALHAGGLRVFEVPLTVPGALDVVRHAKSTLGNDVRLGAGTILDAESARMAILAGADFVVSPSLSLGMIEVARRYSVPCLVGALTPTEVVAAWQAGADCVKVFPASAMGGPAYIKSLRAPLPQISLMPMGGVTLQTARAYLEAGACLLGVGADLVQQAALDDGRDTDLTTAAVAYMSETTQKIPANSCCTAAWLRL